VVAHTGSPPPIHPGWGSWPSDISGSPRCEVYVAHRRYLQDRHRTLLDGLETRRRSRYRFDADRDRFTLATVLLRAVTGRATGVNASAVVVDRTCATCGDPHGRPRLPGTHLEASISHSGDVVAVAVTQAGPVGVDIEQVGAADHADLVSTVCTGSEQRHVGTATDFYAYWTRKEAVLKATGEGLARSMTSIEVTPPGARPSLVSVDRSTDVACRMSDIHLDGYAGAVAVMTTTHVSFGVYDAAGILMAHSTPLDHEPVLVAPTGPVLPAIARQR